MTALTAAPLEWHLAAACRGLTTAERDDIFFPARGDSTGHAKVICATCPVRRECLDYALDAGIKYGVWGGLSERERRHIRGMRRRVA